MRLINTDNNRELNLLDDFGKANLYEIANYFDEVTYYTRQNDLDPSDYDAGDERFAVISQIFSEDESAEMILLASNFMDFADPNHYDDAGENLNAKAFVETLRNKQLYQSFTADEAKKGTNRDIRVGALDLRFVD
ncbi:MAG: hypothetical protein MR609_00180 [Bacteroidales bacterium]|nr:hypothetical protein [Bacteroidales bacterium]